jgi:hypothetical protein
MGKTNKQGVNISGAQGGGNIGNYLDSNGGRGIRLSVHKKMQIPPEGGPESPRIEPTPPGHLAPVLT